MNAVVSEVVSKEAPSALGPYSQGVSVSGASNLVFVSGQLPIDPFTGKMVSGDIREMTSQVIDNIEAILIAGGSSLFKVVRVEIFLTDLARDFGAVNEVYGERFRGEVKPARQTVQVAALPLASPIEISCIGVV